MTTTISRGGNQTTRRFPRRAFTLVELLVVIGIIALLVAVLLPALAGAHRAALAVKCLANLRSCGQALQMYADRNHGYAIPVRVGGSPPQNNRPGTDTSQAVPYEINGFTFGWTADDATHSTSAAWWMSFLATYIAKDAKGGHGDTGSTGYQTRQQEVFYCPAWDGPDWPEVTGYCMNYMPTLSPTHPAIGHAAVAPEVPSSEWANIQLQSLAQGGGTISTSGTWFKLSQIKMATQRCFLADAAGLELECWDWPSSSGLSSITTFPPPQSPLPPVVNAPTLDGGMRGQTTCDWYRHGVYPKQIPAGAFSAGLGQPSWGSNSRPCFDPHGGKISYNILFFDGHAVTSHDRADIYRAVRMRWPG